MTEDEIRERAMRVIADYSRRIVHDTAVDMTAIIESAIRAAVEAEREACAEIAYEIAAGSDGCGYCDDDAALRVRKAIMARDEVDRNRAKEPTK